MRRLIIAILVIAGWATSCRSQSFTWGLDVGSSIDLTAQDMSTINGDAYFGLRTPVTEVIGVGAGIHAMVGNNSFTYPLYAIVRTSFSRKPRLVFGEIRGGVALNTFFGASGTQIAFFLNPSVGFHLATGRTFRSYLAVGYELNTAASDPDPVTGKTLGSISCANVRLGITF